MLVTIRTWQRSAPQKFYHGRSCHLVPNRAHMIPSGYRNRNAIPQRRSERIGRPAGCVVFPADDQRRTRRSGQLRRREEAPLAAHAGGKCDDVFSRLAPGGKKKLLARRRGWG